MLFRSESITGSTTLTVTSAILQSIAVTPFDPRIAVGFTEQFTATGTFSDGTTQDLTTQVTWSSSNPVVAVISNDEDDEGLAKGLTVGSTTISASLGSIIGSITGSTTLIVTDAVLQLIVVTPTNPSIAVGFTEQFTATGTFSDGAIQDLTTQVKWRSSNPSVAFISNAEDDDGLAKGLTVGSTTISAALESITGSTTLTVTSAVLLSISVAPANPSIALGRTQQFIATGTFSDGSTQDLTTQVTWNSTNPGVAVISNSDESEGLAKAEGVGATTISAALESITGSTTLTVTSAVLTSITVTPPNASILGGLTQQFTATGTFSDATTQNITTQVTWNSSNADVALISNAPGSQGVVTSRNKGTSTITATLSGIPGSATLTVTCSFIIIQPRDLPDATVNSLYTQLIGLQTNQPPPYTISLVEGSVLPRNLTVFGRTDNPSLITISGMVAPGTSGSYTFTIRAATTCGTFATETFTLIVR